MKNINRASIFSSRNLTIILLLGIILLGGYFRLVGINWDTNFHLHPDERFLTMVESSISPVKNLSEYFDTQKSTLNPHNAGYSFFVYGTFPIFLVRYVAGWIGWADYNHVFLVGRVLSVIFDLFMVFLVYLCAQRLYQNYGLSLLAAAFSSATVLFIQQAHFFVVDSFANFFTLLAVYFAVCILRSNSLRPIFNINKKRHDNKNWEKSGVQYSLFFGIALGLAASSKINTIVVAVLLPLAIYLNDPLSFIKDHDHRRIYFIKILAVAALVSFLIFRIFQPYAFSGPSFFNFSLNPKWIDNLKELNYLSSGDSNFPPSLQWARRPVWFGLENMIMWGMGLPLGIACIIGFLWMGKKILSGEWKAHLLIWLWTAIYFIWQSLRWNPTMRYFLPIYATAIIIAAWGLVEISKIGKRSIFNKILIDFKWLSIGLIIISTGATFLWAFAFTRIYTRPITRVSASEWIYQNIPSAINISGLGGNGEVNIPLTTSHFFQLKNNQPLIIKFIPEVNGKLYSVAFDHIVDPFNHPGKKNVRLTISTDASGLNPLVKQELSDEFAVGDDPRGNEFGIQIENPLPIQAGITYYLHLDNSNEQTPLQFTGDISITIAGTDSILKQPIFTSSELIGNFGSVLPFIPYDSFWIEKIDFFRAIDWSGNMNEKNLEISIVDAQNPEKNLAEKVLVSRFNETKDYRGSDYSIKLDTPLWVEKNHSYLLKLHLYESSSTIGFSGSRLASESSWDDAIPLAMFGYNPFDYQMGLYQSDLNFEMYWDDNPQKLERFINILTKADVVYISSNRQWGSVTQIPERYPLSTSYYRNLLGCPDEKDIQWCYRVAEPGMFTGKLGFRLVKVFQSDPNINGIRFNSQFAEEAFTVYDHPKVLIFEKDDSFSINKVKLILLKVDLSKVLNLTPKNANLTPGTLTMPANILEKQYSGGTWKELFNLDSVINSNPISALIIWYLLISLIGWINYPLLRLCFRGLDDKGFPVHKLAGLLIFAYIVWIAGSVSLSVNKTTISIIFIFILLVNTTIAVRFKEDIVDEIKKRKFYIFKTEIISLIFFILFLIIRVGNPDLWHPYKGGEKPMDFSYFNAVLKSTVFPPYDPWFAKGYLNYYYFGFVLAGIPVKWVGFNPSVAYNFILPTFFSFTAMGAFSFAWNIQAEISGKKERRKKRELTNNSSHILNLISNPYFWGIIAVIMLLIIGNLGTIRMIFHGFQRLASNGIPIENGSFIQRMIWSLQGFGKVLKGQQLTYYPGDWYWIPSRAIPGESITEFPYFTFLYGDPHAHLFSLPLTLMALGWVLSILLIERDQWYSLRIIGLPILFGSIIIGSLRITNTWDYPVFLFISVIILLYKGVQWAVNRWEKIVSLINFQSLKNIILIAVLVLIFVLGSLMFFYPFSRWYGQAYNSIELWKGSHTPISSYLTHWGLFFFITVSWWILELKNWMAETPLRVLQSWMKFKSAIILGAITVFLISCWLFIRGVEITWLIVPFLLLGIFLFICKSHTDIRRFIDLIALIGWSLTLMVEVIVLKGDIGRMNTVFKFYLQAWSLIALSSCCYLFLFISQMRFEIGEKWNKIWIAVLSFLLIFVFLYPLTATIDKITDRMSNQVPLTLDGMEYMKTSTYMTNGTVMDLSQDYQGIKWIQENVKGSPVIVEANVPEYQWGNRYSIYTGLPGVVGWNWHQRQQRAILPSNWVTDRIDEISNFYSNVDFKATKDFLQKYQIKFIIVGQLEKITYPGIGLEKFEALNHVLWEKVFEYQDTRIYSVIE